MNSNEIQQLDQQYIVASYGRQNLAAASGKNATLTDADGKEYIDFTSGIGVNALGFCNPEWTKAVSEQAATLNHTSNYYTTEPMVKVAELLCQTTGYSKVFFGNSGAEANECAIKAARKYSFDKYGPNRNVILTLGNSFHGRTVTTLSATGQDAMHNFFFPFTEGFEYVEANNIPDLEAKMTDEVCAVFLEFIQGEGGVIPLEPAFVKRVAALCKEKDILFLADEVQTGVGRTGAFLASTLYGVTPNITTLAKGLGGGLPIGAVLFDETTATILGAGTHGSTFGGNPICCAGALVILEQVTVPAFLSEVKAKGEYIRNKLVALPGVGNITGAGMMIGFTVEGKAAGDILTACLNAGLMILTAKEKVRFLPPLTITMEELDQGLDILANVLSANE